MSRIKKVFYLNPDYKSKNWKQPDDLGACLEWFGCPENIETLGLEFSIGDGLFLDDLWDAAFESGSEQSKEYLLAMQYNKIDLPDFNLVRRKSDNALLTNVKLQFIYDYDQVEYSSLKITGEQYVQTQNT